MKKILFLTLSCVMSFSFKLYAQTQRTKNVSYLQKTTLNPIKNPNARNNQSKAAVFWQDDFSDPNNWWVDNWWGLSYNWEIRNYGPQGPNSSSMGTIASTTASNGFAIFDSDQDCGWGAVGDLHYSGTVSALGHTNVTVEFEQLYAKYTDKVYFWYSTDNSTYYGKQINTTYTQNQVSPNPDLVSFDISSVAANKPNIYFYFSFEDGSGNCGYAWMIDDLKFIDNNASSLHDLAVTKAFANDVSNNEYDYSIVSNNQRTPLKLNCLVKNLGGFNESNITVNAVVNDGTSNVYTGSQTISNLSYLDSANLIFNTAFTPAINKNYTVTYTLTNSADQDNTNNTLTKSFKTVADIYAHDYNSTQAFGFNQDDEFSIGNAYKVYSTAKLYGLDVEFKTGTTANSNVIARVYQVGSGIQNLTLITQQTYKVLSTDIGTGNKTKILFTTPPNLTAGNKYVVEIYKATGTTRLYIAGSLEGDDDNSTVCYGNFGTSYNWYDAWGASPYVRMNFGIGCSDFTATTSTSSAISCNPNSGSIALSSSGTNALANQYTYSWTGAMTGTSGAGKSQAYTITNLIAGTYNVTVTNNGCTFSKSVTVGSSIPPTINITQVSPIACFGMTNGSLKYTLSTPLSSSFDITWNTGQSTTAISNIGAGTYTVTATDGVCVLTKSFTLTEPNQILIAYTPTNASACGVADGSIALTAANGINPVAYTYSWTGTATGTSGGSQNSNYTMTGLASGAYLITVTNSTCSNSISASLTDGPISISESQPISCDGGNDGTLTVNSFAGSGTYTYLWNNGATSQSASGLSVGNYSVTATKANCKLSSSYFLNEPSPIVITGNATASTINTSIIGGNGNYSFLWSGPSGFSSTNQNLSGLTSLGTYTLTVTDPKGCTATKAFILAFLSNEELVITENKFKMYPNPAQENVTFELNNQVKNILIFDYSGKLITTINVENNTEVLNISEYSKGLYLCKIIGKENQVLETKKLAIQ